MKIISLLLLTLFLVMIPAYGQMLSDTTGLVNRLNVQTGGHTFEVETVSNFDIFDFSFDKDQKKLTLYITSNLENNLGEIIIPQTLLKGDFMFHLNDEEFFPKFNSNEKISFIQINFTGSGDNKLEISGTTYLNGLTEKDEIELLNEPSKPLQLESSPEGGCLIATATYGSELAPQVQQLRELRDNYLLQTQSGSFFMNSFNEFYYSFSPTIADLERENPQFREITKIVITPMISSLSILNYVDMNSETKVLGYGISLILLNVGMYFVAPVIIVVQFYKLKSKLN